MICKLIHVIYNKQTNHAMLRDLPHKKSTKFGDVISLRHQILPILTLSHRQQVNTNYCVEVTVRQ